MIKLYLFLLKNFRIQYRSFFTCREILFLVTFLIFIILLLTVAHEEEKVAAIEHKPFQIATAENLISRKKLLFSPNSTEIRNIMSCFKSLMRIKGFKTSQDLVNYYSNDPDHIFAAIEFNAETLAGENVEISIRFPSELRYPGFEVGNEIVLDWRTDKVYPPNLGAGPRSPEDAEGSIPQYTWEGFLTMQLYTSFFVMKRKQIKNMCANVKSLNDLLDTEITMQRFPYGQHTVVMNQTVMASSFCAIFIILFTYAAVNITVKVTLEKEQKLKESMRIMGMPNWVYWMSSFLGNFLLLTIVVALITIIVYAQGIFRNSSHALIFLFFLMYVPAIIAQSLAASTLFSRALFTGLFNCFWCIYSYNMTDKYVAEQVGLLKKILLCLTPNGALMFGIHIIFMHEGINFSNLDQPLNKGEKFTFFHVLLMLIVDTIIYMFITYYVDLAFPGTYGTAQPWYFICSREYWTKTNAIGVEEIPKSAILDPKRFEKEPENLMPSIKIRNLRKVYKTGIAVHTLNINFYKNQITVILGRIGAGKSTLLSMLSGMTKPSSGTALISGFDLRVDMEKIRSRMGICVQEDVIFDRLTAEETLRFFCQLKGMKNDSEIQNEVMKFMMGLRIMPFTQARHSPRDVKRKISIGVALCADSKIVLLDEPSSEMDMLTRRELWDFLKEEKMGRTIVISTNAMDEADYLGDRIVIMDHGDLLCAGSSSFLKERVANGYHLILEKSENCDPAKVTAFLKKFIAQTQLYSNSQAEVTYILPENVTEHFENLFKNLESNLDQLGIKNIRLSLKNLEDVFLKKKADDSGNKDTPNAEANIDFKINEKYAPNKSTVWMYQMCAMFYKRFMYIFRNKFMLLFHLLFPIILIILKKLVLDRKGSLVTKDLPAMPLTMAQFPSPISLMEGENSFSKTYADLVPGPKAVDQSSSIRQYMLQMSEKDFKLVRRSYIIGAQFVILDRKKDLNSINCYFNNDPYHSPAIALGYVLNSIFKTTYKQTIDFINYPLPFTAQMKTVKNTRTRLDNCSYLAFGLMFMATYCIFFYTKERATQFKHLQLVAGIKAWVFWLVAFFIDFILVVIQASLLLLTFIIIDNAHKSGEQIGLVYYISFCFAWCALPFTYIISYFFVTPMYAYIVVLGFHALEEIAYATVELFGRMHYSTDWINTLFLLEPYYNLICCFQDSFTLLSYREACSTTLSSCIDRNHSRSYCDDIVKRLSFAKGETCEDTENVYQFKRPGIGKNLAILLIEGLLLIIIMIVNEYNLLSKPLSMLESLIFTMATPPEPISDQDEDVNTEKKRIRDAPKQALLKDNMVVAEDVSKYYGNVLAVKTLSFAVKQNECFGLLGINGAGKTTTIRMLTGDLNISSGNIWIDGLDLRRNINKIHKKIGYVPQTDPFIEEFTVKETLVILLLVHGATTADAKNMAEQISKDYDIFSSLHEKIETLNNTDKKKLAAALAMLGDPLILFLDEPTSGLDEATKNFIWNMITKIRNEGRCVFLATKSMEECETLCGSVAILINGQFKCLGTKQTLHQRFSAAYILTVKMQYREITRRKSFVVSRTNIEKYILTNIPSAKLSDKHDELITFHLYDPALKLSKLFKMMETAKKDEEMNVESYTLSQGSLQEIFMNFAKYQR